jgi:hypothetical protein
MISPHLDVLARRGLRGFMKLAFRRRGRSGSGCHKFSAIHMRYLTLTGVVPLLILAPRSRIAIATRIARNFEVPP